MKRNKAARRWLRKRKHAVKGGLAKLVDLTGKTHSKPETQPPSLPQAQAPSNESGIIRQNVAAFRLPNALADASERESSEWMPSKFVFVVVGLAILFIAIVAWQVSQMPVK